MDEEKIVEEGYNRIGKRYQDARNEIDSMGEFRRFMQLLPKNARVLDAGCGTGMPTMRFLADNGFKVVGIDISEEMIKLARENVPEAVLKKGNIADLDFPENYFDGIISIFAIIHVPKEKHKSMFPQFSKILKPNGILLVSLGPDEWEGLGKFLGERMFWSHYDSVITASIIRESGFDIIEDWFTTFKLRNEIEKHYWILAKKSR